MPVDVFETTDDGNNWTILFSGGSHRLAYPPPKRDERRELRFYADSLDTYVCGEHTWWDPTQEQYIGSGGWCTAFITRINTTPVSGYRGATAECTPWHIIPGFWEEGWPPRFLMTHYLNEIGMAQYSVALKVSGCCILTTYYPEYDDDWYMTWCASEEGNLTGIDITFPDMPDSPRFLIATDYLANISGIYVVLTDTERLENFYPANLHGFHPSGIVTDLETTRFI